MKISVLRLCASCFAKDQWGYKGLFKMAVCQKKIAEKAPPPAVVAVVVVHSICRYNLLQNEGKAGFRFS